MDDMVNLLNVVEGYRKKEAKCMSRVFLWMLVVGWMGCIFFLSHQPATASSTLSLEITEMFLLVINQLIPNATIELDVFHFIVRKSAHFFAYFILGMLAYFAFLKSDVHLNRSALYAFFLSVLYAMTDEVHQLFIPGRSGQVQDVLIDSAGAFVGIFFIYVLLRCKYR